MPGVHTKLSPWGVHVSSRTADVWRVSIDDPEPCCHVSPAAHLAELALLATLLIEHDLLGTLLDRVSAGGNAEMMAGPLSALVDIHGAAVAALHAWKAETA
jgi:hypothetical protein